MRFVRFIISILFLASIFEIHAQDEYRTIIENRRATAPNNNYTFSSDGEHFIFTRGNSILLSPVFQRDVQKEIFTAPGRINDYSVHSNNEFAIVGCGARKAIYRHSFTTDYYLLHKGEEESLIADNCRDITLSPNYKYIAYSKENNLYLYFVENKETRRITADGQWNKIINGTSDWVYEEEYGFTKAYSFSNDSKHIAYLKFDESEVPCFEMMRYDRTLYNKAFSFKYPKAGDKNSRVELWVYNIDNNTHTRIDTGKESDQYILCPRWTEDNRLYFYRVNRLQNFFEVLMLDNDSKIKTIYQEKSQKYVDRPNAATITFLDKDIFIVKEETTKGWMHLSLHSISKGFRNYITSGKWEVTSIVGVREGYIYYISTEGGPVNRTLYRVKLNGKGKERLSDAEGWSSVNASPSLDKYILTHNSANTPSVVTINNYKGEVLDTICDMSKAELKGYVAPKIFKEYINPAGDTLLYYVQYPKDFDPAKKYPVLLTQYSGPGSQEGANRFRLDWEYAIVEKGYIVVCLDGRGTGYRGETFKKSTYLNLGKIEVEDQINFARYLATLPYIDSERIGIYGWSYGGFMSLNCALHGEGLFKMAIAVAPVTSWRYYDTIYTEIYNGLPQDNSEGYDNNSPLMHADKLSSRTRLLIMHGTADDNVHIQNTMEMCYRLDKAGKQYDMMIYPDQNHSMRPNFMNNIRQKMIDYTLNNL